MSPDKTILITGVGHGIGFAIAKAVEEFASTLILTTKSQESATRLEGEFPTANIHQFDLTDETKTSEFLDEIRRYGKLDVLVNNAGFYVGKRIDNITVEEFDTLYEIHMKAPFMLIKHLLPLLRASDCSQVINISSAANYARIPGESAYTAMKAGLTALTDVLREELQEFQIRFTTIHPWAVNTHDAENPETCLRPEDIGQLVSFIINTHPNCQIMNVELSSVLDWRGGWPPWIPK
jgi:NADP-dependent 3-hydroxy acid dehydrogenase YdfG